MNPLAVSALVMAGITFYAGFYHLLIYRQQKERRESLTFALTCMAVGLYAIAAAGLYNTASVDTGAQWQRVQLVALALVSVAFLWFAADYTSYKSKRILYPASAYFFLSAVISLVDRSDLTLIVDQPSVKEIRLPLVTEITYYETTLGPLATLQNAMGLLVAIYVVWSGVRFYRSGHEREARPLLVAMVLFLVCVVNDTFVGYGLYPFVYVLEYAYVGFVLVMAHSLSGVLANALSVAQQRGQELAVTRQQAEQAAQAEREARLREREIARQMQQTIREYILFLDRVAAGNYSVRLELDELEQSPSERIRELLVLGQHLNTTVESLVQALDELQAIQRRYAREAWERFVRIRAAHAFRYHGTAQGATVEPDDEAWLPSMTSAVQQKDMISDEHELALPITLRDEIIGSIGVRREEIAGWSEEDIALVQSITDQLSQTMESLRLLGETQRRAAREQLTARITAQVRASTEVDTILRTAIQELGQGLQAADGLIRLRVGDGPNSLPKPSRSGALPPNSGTKEYRDE
jgi:GAF domain-containing protein